MLLLLLLLQLEWGEVGFLLVEGFEMIDSGSMEISQEVAAMGEVILEVMNFQGMVGVGAKVGEGGEDEEVVQAEIQ